MSVNLYILLIAPSGCGKTPSTKIWLSPLSKLEEEEVDAFNVNLRESHGKNNKNVSSDGDDFDGNGERTHGKGAQKDVNGFLFHPKTRVCESITAEALLETLKSNSGSILIKTDEFKASSTHS